MRIHLRADSVNGIHAKITVFINGANCGQLTMREQEAKDWLYIVRSGVSAIDSLEVSGEWVAEKVEDERHNWRR